MQRKDTTGYLIALEETSVDHHALDPTSLAMLSVVTDTNLLYRCQVVTAFEELLCKCLYFRMSQ